jgi:hypothetical protein
MMDHCIVLNNLSSVFITQNDGVTNTAVLDTTVIYHNVLPLENYTEVIYCHPIVITAIMLFLTQNDGSSIEW